MALALAYAVYRWGPRRRRPVYLLDFALWRSDPKLTVSLARFMQGSRACEVSGTPCKHCQSAHDQHVICFDTPALGEVQVCHCDVHLRVQ